MKTSGDQSWGTPLRRLRPRVSTAAHFWTWRGRTSRTVSCQQAATDCPPRWQSQPSGEAGEACWSDSCALGLQVLVRNFCGIRKHTQTICSQRAQGGSGMVSGPLTLRDGSTPCRLCAPRGNEYVARTSNGTVLAMLQLLYAADVGCDGPSTQRSLDRLAGCHTALRRHRTSTLRPTWPERYRRRLRVPHCLTCLRDVVAHYPRM